MDATAWMQTLTDLRPAVACLPLPPSVNHYLKKTSRGVYLSKAAKRFRAEVKIETLQQGLPKFTRPVAATLEIHPPDRSCDLDNFEKSLWDALQHAGTLVNDSQVACVLRFWGSSKKAGGLTLRIAEITDGDLVASLPLWTDQTGSKKERNCGAKRNGKQRRSTNVRRYGVDQ